MSPPYIFKVDELRENPGIAPDRTTEGQWKPSIHRGYNYKLGRGELDQGVSGKYWYCQGGQIRYLEPQAVPQTLHEYKTFSLFYSHGYGLWVLKGDATNPAPGSAWNPLRFEYGHIGKSSFLTPAGEEEAMEWQRDDQHWAGMLLPTIYHGQLPPNPQYGGLVGELPIFLALVALSMQSNALEQWLPWMFQSWRWKLHSLPHGRMHKRGVVVNVYLCPTNWATGGSIRDLESYESGRSRYGKYFN